MPQAQYIRRSCARVPFVVVESTMSRSYRMTGPKAIMMVRRGAVAASGADFHKVPMPGYTRIRPPASQLADRARGQRCGRDGPASIAEEEGKDLTAASRARAIPGKWLRRSTA